MERNCPVCKKTIKGRSDKKFCNDYCRNTHNNLINSKTTSIIRNTNHSLSKNRRILMELLDPEVEYCKLNKEDVLQNGFVFKYHTHTKTLKTGERLYFCYDIGYMKLENEKILIIKADHK